jgi:hypothetical protein
MDNLNASIFQYNSESYELEFENILDGITTCYHMMIKDNVILPNDENKIRDTLRKNYLNNREIRDKISFTAKYNFERETLEDNDLGRVDIKITTQNTLTEPNAYFIIECKRLNNENVTGVSGLNAEYIKNGIKRFVDGKYSSYHRLNGMIGFVVQQMDISENISNINNLLANNFADANTKTFLTSTTFIKNFNYQYHSIHKDVNKKTIKLYHLMFDFSKNMDKKKDKS